MQKELLRLEYETTPNPDIDYLCGKYEVNKEDLEWYKPPKEVKTEVITTPKPPTPTTPKPTPSYQIPNDMARDIKLTKEQIVIWARRYIETEGDLNPKEVKDIVNIIGTIEGSIQPANTTNVNILVQTLMSSKDDC